MDDETLGFEIWKRTNCVGRTTHATIGRAARELLAKPVATREKMHHFIHDKFGIQPDWVMDKMVDAGLAALSHFAPPASPRMLIEGMSVAEIERAMKKERNRPPAPISWDHCDAARVAHRLATTPAPEVDPDKEAKRLAWEHYRNSYETGANPHHKDQESLWCVFTEQNRSGWRAVAAAKKEAGGE